MLNTFFKFAILLQIIKYYNRKVNLPMLIDKYTNPPFSYINPIFSGEGLGVHDLSQGIS